MRYALLAPVVAICVTQTAGAALAQDSGAATADPSQTFTTQPDAAPLSTDQRAELFSDIMSMAETAPEESLQRMIALAETGDTKAQQEVGTFYRRGIGTPVDLPLAKLWYERAIDGGRPYALAPLARVEAALNNGEAAYDLLKRAIAEDMPGAERQLGFAHIDKQLGRYSDPALGQRQLMQLVDEGDRPAARPLLLRYNWNRLSLPAPDRLIAQVEADGLAGDGPSAEAALVYLTKAQRYSRSARARRQALIQVDGIRQSILASERMWLAADLSPRSFFSEADRIIATTPREHFSRAALIANRVSANAYVRILQRELQMQGYYRGRISGWLTASTIDAHHRFCLDAGILQQCQEGPLRAATIRAVTEALASYSPHRLK